MIENSSELSKGPSQAKEIQANEPSKLSRREALAILGRYAIYTPPAVLAVLSLKSKGAHAIPPGSG